MSRDLKKTMQTITKNITQYQIPRAFSDKQTLKERARILGLIISSASLLSSYAASEREFLLQGWEGELESEKPERSEE